MLLGKFGHRSLHAPQIHFMCTFGEVSGVGGGFWASRHCKNGPNRIDDLILSWIAVSYKLQAHILSIRAQLARYSEPANS